MPKENMYQKEVLISLQDLCKNNKEAKQLLDEFANEYLQNISNIELITKSYNKLKEKLNNFEDFEWKQDIFNKLENLKTLLWIATEITDKINEATSDFTKTLWELNWAQEVINDYWLFDEISSDKNYSEITSLAGNIWLKKTDDWMYSALNKIFKDSENISVFSEKIKIFKIKVEKLKNENEELKKSANSWLNFLRDDIEKRAKKMEEYFPSKEQDKTWWLHLSWSKKDTKRLKDLSNIKNLNQDIKSKKQIEGQFKKQIKNLKNFDSEFLTELENKVNEVLKNKLFENNTEIKNNLTKIEGQKDDLHKIVNPENWTKEDYENFWKWSLENDTESDKKNELKTNFNANSEIFTNWIWKFAKSLKDSLEEIKKNNTEFNKTKKVQKERIAEFTSADESEEFNEFEATRGQVEWKFAMVESEYKKTYDKISNFKELDLIKSEFENVKNIFNSESSNTAKFVYLNNFEKFLKQFENLDEHWKEKVDFNYIQEKEQNLFNEANDFLLLNENWISEIKNSWAVITELLIKYNSATTETDKKLYLSNLKKENDKLNKISENIEREKILLENLKNTAKNFVKWFNKNFDEKKKYFQLINWINFSEIKNIKENIFENIKNKKDLNKKFEEIKNSLKENNEKLKIILIWKISQIESDREKYWCETFVTLNTKNILRWITESNEELDKIDFKLVYTEKEKKSLIKEIWIDYFNSYLVDLRTEINNSFIEKDNKLKEELKNLSWSIKSFDKIVETTKVNIENLKTWIKSTLDNIDLDYSDIIKSELQKIINWDNIIPAHTKARAEKLIWLIDNQENIEQNFISETKNKNKLSEIRDISKKVNSLSDLYEKLNNEDDLEWNLEWILDKLDSTFFKDLESKEGEKNNDNDDKENDEELNDQLNEEIEQSLDWDISKNLTPWNNWSKLNSSGDKKSWNFFSKKWWELKKFWWKMSNFIWGLKNPFWSKNKKTVTKASEWWSWEQNLKKDYNKTAS